jgi:hypothetical protein
VARLEPRGAAPSMQQLRVTELYRRAQIDLKLLDEARDRPLA